jgi:hypothetical protein
MATQTAQAVRGNLPSARLRWTIPKIGSEFGMAPDSARKLLNQAGAEPDASGCYATGEVVQALFGNLYNEKVKKERALARKYELENQITEGEFLNRVELEKSLGQLAAEMVFIIETSDLNRQAQDDLRNALANIPIEIAGVAKSQTKSLRRSKNGEKPEEDGDESLNRRKKRVPTALND